MLLKKNWTIKISKDELAIIIVAFLILSLFAFLHLRGIKKNQDNTRYENYLKKDIQDKQQEIDKHKQNIVDLQNRMSTLKGEVVFIDSKEQTTKNKYKDEKKYIDLATPSQQSSLLSANLNQLKDLDREGYFDLPQN
jgi:predicted  nucleic acid-binding Zn-ribbon protein